MSDVIVLHVKMGEVGGKAKVAYARDLIIIQVKDGEVSTHGEIPLKTELTKSGISHEKPRKTSPAFILGELTMSSMLLLKKWRWVSVVRYSGKERPLFFLKFLPDLAIRSMVRRTMVAHPRG